MAVARTTPATCKIAVRAAANSLLASISPVDIASESADVAARVLAHPAYAGATSVAMYVSMERELDISAVARDAFASGKRVYLPRMVGKGKPLQMAAVDGWDEFCNLPETVWGIPQPGPDAPVADHVDLVLVPGLVFDPLALTRCGRGAGYYDRTLSGMAAAAATSDAPPPFKLAVGLSCAAWAVVQRALASSDGTPVPDALPITEYDVLMDDVLLGATATRSP